MTFHNPFARKSQPSAASFSKEELVQIYRNAVLSGVPLSTVQHKVHETLHRLETTLAYEKNTDRLRVAVLQPPLPWQKQFFVHVIPALCMALGVFLVGNAVWPVVSYFLFTAPRARARELLSPIPAGQLVDAQPTVITANSGGFAANLGSGLGAGTLGLSQQALGDAPQNQPTVIGTELDYTNLSNWFPTMEVPTEEYSSPSEYQLDIPSLEIASATIRIGGTNLDKSLIQYPGTALPGQAGAPVIFGHSVLRQFYDPRVKNPRRYFSIFSKIMTLKPGEKIFITYDHIRYTYIVRDNLIVKPEDTEILEQEFNSKKLKLVTCVPEGTYLRRGIVVAELVTSPVETP